MSWRRVLLALFDAYLWCARWPGTANLELAASQEARAKRYRDEYERLGIKSDLHEARRCEREAARLRTNGERFLKDFPEFRFGVLVLCIIGALLYCACKG